MVILLGNPCGFAEKVKRELQENTPTPTDSTPEDTSTPIPIYLKTPTQQPFDSPTPLPPPTWTFTVTVEKSPTPSFTPTPRDTNTPVPPTQVSDPPNPSPTFTFSPTFTPEESDHASDDSGEMKPTYTPTPSAPLEPMETYLPTSTPTNSPLATNTPTHTYTFTVTKTNTPTWTPTSTYSFTPTETNTPSITPTWTITSTNTPREGNHAPIISIHPAEVGMVLCGERRILSLVITDQEHDPVTISLSDNAPAKLDHYAAFGGIVFQDIVLDTDRETDCYSFSIFAYDGSHCSVKEVRFILVEAYPTVTPTPSQTQTPTLTPTCTFTETATHTFTRTPTITFTCTSTCTITLTPTLIVTYTVPPTLTPSRTFSPSPTCTSTPTISPTCISTKTPSCTPTPSFTLTHTATHTPTYTSTPTITSSPTNTVTYTPTFTPTQTCLPSFTSTLTPSFTSTKTMSPTKTTTVSPTATFTEIPTSTATLTIPPSFTITSVPTLTPFPTFTVMPKTSAPILDKIPDLRIVCRQPAVDLLKLDEYVHDGDTPKKDLVWSIQSEKDAPTVVVDWKRCLSIFDSSHVGVYPATVSVSDGHATASQILQIKVSHFLISPFCFASPIILSVSEIYRTPFSLYDGIIPRDFPRACIRFELKKPLPAGIAEVEILEDGSLQIHAEENPPHRPVLLPVLAYYQTYTPTPIQNNTPTVQPPQKTATPSCTPTRIPDLVFQTSDDVIAFIQQNVESVGKGPIDLQCADFNHDGYPDFVTANYDSDTATILLSDDQSYERRDVWSGEGCCNVFTPDIQGDGWDDLVTLSAIDSTLSVYLGSQESPLLLSDQMILFEGYPFPEEQLNRSRIRLLAAGCFGEAGETMFCIGNLESFDLYSLDDDGKMIIEGREFIDFEPIQLWAADLNKDGIEELVVSHARPSGLSVFSFQSETMKLIFYSNLDITFPGNIPEGLFVKDVNADSYPDVVVFLSDRRMLILFGGETYDLVAQPVPDAQMVIHDLTVGDFNHDNIDEILLAGLDIQNAKPVLTAFSGKRLGQYTDLDRVYIDRPYPLHQIFSLSTCDLNRDGSLDLALADRVSGCVMVYLNLLAGRGG